MKQIRDASTFTRQLAVILASDDSVSDSRELYKLAEWIKCQRDATVLDAVASDNTLKLLSCFTSEATSAIKRRSVGILLCELLEDPSTSKSLLNAAPAQLQLIGDMFVCSTKDLQLLANEIMRQLSLAGANIDSFFGPAGSGKPLAAIDQAQMEFFQNFLDNPHGATLMDDKYSTVFGANDVSVDDSMPLRNGRKSVHVIIENRLITLIIPSSSTRLTQYIDIPIRYVWQVEIRERSWRSGSGRRKDTRVVELVLRLGGTEENYLVNSEWRRAEEVVVVFDNQKLANQAADALVQTDMERPQMKVSSSQVLDVSRPLVARHSLPNTPVKQTVQVIAGDTAATESIQHGHAGDSVAKENIVVGDGGQKKGRQTASHDVLSSTHVAPLTINRPSLTARERLEQERARRKGLSIMPMLRSPKATMKMATANAARGEPPSEPACQDQGTKGNPTGTFSVRPAKIKDQLRIHDNEPNDIYELPASESPGERKAKPSAKKGRRVKKESKKGARKTASSKPARERKGEHSQKTLSAGKDVKLSTNPLDASYREPDQDSVPASSARRSKRSAAIIAIQKLRESNYSSVLTSQAVYRGFQDGATTHTNMPNQPSDKHKGPSEASARQKDAIANHYLFGNSQENAIYIPSDQSSLEDESEHSPPRRDKNGQKDFQHPAIMPESRRVVPVPGSHSRRGAPTGPLLVDDNLARKESLVSFGPRGPLNQGGLPTVKTPTPVSRRDPASFAVSTTLVPRSTPLSARIPDTNPKPLIDKGDVVPSSPTFHKANCVISGRQSHAVSPKGEAFVSTPPVSVSCQYNALMAALSPPILQDFTPNMPATQPTEPKQVSLKRERQSDISLTQSKRLRSLRDSMSQHCTDRQSPESLSPAEVDDRSHPDVVTINSAGSPARRGKLVKWFRQLTNRSSSDQDGTYYVPYVRNQSYTMAMQGRNIPVLGDRRISPVTDVLSSNSKPIPACPLTESQAISGYMTERVLNEVGRSGEHARQLDDPFSAENRPRETAFVQSLKALRHGQHSNDHQAANGTSVVNDVNEDTVVVDGGDAMSMSSRSEDQSGTHVKPGEEDAASQIDEMEWKASLQPHQRDIIDELSLIARRLVSRLNDAENATNDFIKGYNNDGLSLVQRMQEANRQELKAYSAACSDAVNRVRVELEAVVARVKDIHTQNTSTLREVHSWMSTSVARMKQIERRMADLTD